MPEMRKVKGVEFVRVVAQSEATELDLSDHFVEQNLLKALSNRDLRCIVDPPVRKGRQSLRKKIQPEGVDQVIRTQRGFGYVIEG